MKTPPLLALLSFVAFVLFASGEETAPLTLVQTIPLETVEGRIDHMAADVSGQRLFVAALGSNTVVVVDLKAGRKIQSLPGFAEPQGLAYVAEFEKLFVANRSDGTCRILDGHSFETIGTVALGDNADNVRYDETAKKIYVGYGSGALCVLDAKTGAKVADIQLSAHPESFRLETGGVNIFVNIPKTSDIEVNREKASSSKEMPIIMRISRISQRRPARARRSSSPN